MNPITGKVIHGDGYGRKLGFPTINLDTPRESLPEMGVYSGNANIDGKDYRAGIVIGPMYKVDANIIGYNGDAYGKIVTLKPDKFLREYKNFNTEEELINQIKKDISQC
jgi:riboflavin kinase/FMN adenylyltransferase